MESLEIPVSIPCKLWHDRHPRTGYGRRYHKGKRQPAHRVEWMLQRGDIPEGMYVLHHCDNPPCVEISHLFLGTQQDNMMDMSSKGRQRGYGDVVDSAGENNVNAKLTAEKVLEIRHRIAMGESRKLVAHSHGIGVRCVSSIVTRRTWKDV